MAGDASNGDYVDGPYDEYGNGDDEALRQEEERARAADRRRWIVAALIAIAIIVLILLLLRSCVSVGSDVNTGEKRIVPVPTEARKSDVISVWIEPTDSLKRVLSAARVRSTQTVSMGEGLYFVFLPEGESPRAAIERLRDEPGVHDAGFSYESGLREPIRSAPTTP